MGVDLEKLAKSERKKLNALEKLLVELPKLTKCKAKKKGSMVLVKHSDLSKDGEWSVDWHESERLKALAEKIDHMVNRRRGGWLSVYAMVQSISDNTIKCLTKPDGSRGREGRHLGYGHFRWNERAYTLNSRELARLTEYFKL